MSLFRKKSLDKIVAEAQVTINNQKMAAIVDLKNQIGKLVIEISEKIYQADIPFEPLIGKEYHLYESNGVHRLMLIGPDEWGNSKKNYLSFIATVKLQSDHTWLLMNTLDPT